MAEDYLPTRRQLAWLGVLVVVGIAVGTGIGLAIYGAPHLPPPNPEGPPDLVVDVTLVEFDISSEVVQIPEGAEVEFVASNDGDLQHDFKVFGQTGVERVPPGARDRFRYGPVTEEITAWCTIPGHREQGMEITFTLGEPLVGTADQ